MPFVAQFDPVAVSLGPLSLRWYGLAYLAGFLCFWLLGRARLRAPDSWHARRTGLDDRGLEDLLFIAMIGVVIGGRLGFVLFFDPAGYAANPLEALAIWKGGMAFHGGLVGVLVAMWWFARRRGTTFLRIADFVAPLVPLGLGFGRLGNFVNGEHWGRLADPALPWAMAFPTSGDLLARHPAQLYQALAEGLVLFALLWWRSRRERPEGEIAGWFLVGYGVLRFVTEFYRTPDAIFGVVEGALTMGQVLCVPMVLAGAWLLARARAR